MNKTLANPINDQNWDQLGKIFQSAAPFPSICIDNFLSPEFATTLSRSYPNFNSAQEQGREFRTVNEKNKVEITDPTKFSKPASVLHNALASKGFLTSMQTLSGIDNLQFDDQFQGGGMHMTNQSGILDVHIDFNYSKKLKLYRRLNILIYLNEEWHEDWGGKVELWDRKVENCVASFSPIISRCIIFATSEYSFHGVTAVNSPLEHTRKSFALYLYNDEANSARPEEHHSTIFKARPNEKLKKYYSMPMEAGKKKLLKTYHSGRQLVKKALHKN